MKSNLIHKLLPKSKFVRNISILAGGTASAQLLMVLASPLLTRLYSPADLGLLAVYTGLFAIISVVSGLSYELAIPLPESDQEAIHIAVVALISVTTVSLLTAIGVLIAGDQIAEVLGVAELSNILWLLPFGIAFQGAYKILNFWAVRSKEFPVIARTRIAQAVTMLAIQLLGHKAGSSSLVSGHTIGQLAGSLTLIRSAFRRLALKKWRWNGVWRMAKRHRKFPLFSTWSEFFNAVGQQLPPLMFAALFSAGAAGLYALAHRVLTVPVTVVGQAVAGVFFADAAEAYRERRLAKLVGIVHDRLAKVAMPPMLALAVVGPEFFSLVFGGEWRDAGEFARWMTPWLYLVFVTSPLSLLFPVLEKQKELMLFQVVVLFARVSSILLGAWSENLFLTILLFVAANAICRTALLCWITLISGNSFKTIGKSTINSFGISLVMALPLVFSKTLQPASSAWWVFVALSCSSMSIYYYHLLRKESNA